MNADGGTNLFNGNARPTDLILNNINNNDNKHKNIIHVNGNDSSGDADGARGGASLGEVFHHR